MPTVSLLGFPFCLPNLLTAIVLASGLLFPLLLLISSLSAKCRCNLQPWTAACLREWVACPGCLCCMPLCAWFGDLHWSLYLVVLPCPGVTSSRRSQQCMCCWHAPSWRTCKWENHATHWSSNAKPAVVPWWSPPCWPPAGSTAPMPGGAMSGSNGKHVLGV